MAYKGVVELKQLGANIYVADLTGISVTRKGGCVGEVFSGVIKSVVFGLAIALISCQQGFATTGGAEGVGHRTTASVVSILFTLILLDAGFTMFFHAFQL